MTTSAVRCLPVIHQTSFLCTEKNFIVTVPQPLLYYLFWRLNKLNSASLRTKGMTYDGNTVFCHNRPAHCILFFLLPPPATFPGLGRTLLSVRPSRTSNHFVRCRFLKGEMQGGEGKGWPLLPFNYLCDALLHIKLSIVYYWCTVMAPSSKSKAAIPTLINNYRSIGEM